MPDRPRARDRLSHLDATWCWTRAIVELGNLPRGESAFSSSRISMRSTSASVINKVAVEVQRILQRYKDLRTSSPILA